MAPKILIPKPNQTNTPKGMEGVRPGSPAAIKAGYKPPKPLKGPGGPPMTVSFNADGTTTSKPKTTTTTANLTPPPATPAPRASYDYSAGFAADPRYAPGIANIAANQVGIGNQYGLVINRDTNPSSPTYGMAMWLAPGQEPGTGTITAKIDPVTGLSVYSDATGKVFDVKDITIDIRELKPGEPGYLKGSIGNTTAQSQNQQYNIGNQSAQGGARRSGMRSSVAAMEVGALQGALSNLGLGSATAFRGTTDDYLKLLNAIFPDQADKAAALASAGTTPPAPVVETPSVVIPDAAPNNTDPITQTGLVSGQALSGGPEGQFMGTVRGVLAIREISPKARIEQLRFIGRNYALTPQQRRYLDNEIEKFRKLSKVD